MNIAIVAVVSFITGACASMCLVFIPVIKPKKSRPLTKEEWKAGMNENNTL